MSYPYEWTPGMLRDAALLQLDLLLAALDEDLTLKDATPYNVQFRGALPVFVDVGSFEPLRAGEPWVAYRQFCELYLYPLLLAAWKGVPFQPWLRGSLEGIRPSEMRALMSLRDRFRRGALAHVFLHARLERSYGRSGRTGGDVKKELRSAGFSKEMVRANVRKMRKLVERAQLGAAGGRLDRVPRRQHVHGRRHRRQGRLRRGRRRHGSGPGWSWDLGCNDGRHAEISARHAGLVVAVDSRPRAGRAALPPPARGAAAPTSCRSRSTSSTPRRGWAGAAASAAASRTAGVPTSCSASRCCTTSASPATCP